MHKRDPLLLPDIFEWLWTLFLRVWLLNAEGDGNSNTSDLTGGD